MTNDSESNISVKPSGGGEGKAGLLKMGAVAVASALLGGMAVTWWYRKTVRKLHESGENSSNPHFGIGEDSRAEDQTDEF